MIIIFFLAKESLPNSHHSILLFFFFFFFRQRVSDDCHSKSIFPIDGGTFYAGLRYFVSMVLHLTFSFHLFYFCVRCVSTFFSLIWIKEYNLAYSPSYKPFQQILNILTQDISKNAPWFSQFALKRCQKKCTVKYYVYWLLDVYCEVMLSLPCFFPEETQTLKMNPLTICKR